MPSFKPKTNKKVRYNKRSAITLDTKHKEILTQFSKDDEDIIPNLKYERQLLKKQLSKELSIEQQLDIEDKINNLTEKIKEIKLKKKEYFLDNSKFIFDYFENKKNISEGGNAVNTSSYK